MLELYSCDIEALICDRDLYEKYYDSLSDYRKRKISTLKNLNDRARSVGAGVLLRIGLEEIGIKEREARFDTGKNGKPFLKDNSKIFFNLSHSQTRVFCAVSDRNVGCDVEQIRLNEQRVKKITDRFFSAEEKKYMDSSSDSGEYCKRFYMIWTMKESYIKYTGAGLECPFGSFSVVRENGSVARIPGCRFLIKKNGMEDGLIVGDDDGYMYAVCIETGLREEYGNVRISPVKL